MREMTKKGFTIIELMVGVVLSSILAITAGVMLYYIFSSWKNNSIAVELQRDATVAIDMMARRIRPSPGTYIRSGGSQYFSDADSISIGQLSSPTENFWRSGDTLWYSHGSQRFVIIPSNQTYSDKIKLTYIKFTKDAASHSVIIKLKLEANNTPMILDPIQIGYRND